MTLQLGREDKQNVYNSYYIEYMTAAFQRNIFNLFSFVQVVLGSTVMANISNTFVAGLFMTLLSAYIFVYKPGEKSTNAKQQAKRYEKLISNLDAITHDELKNRLHDYVDQDSDPIGLIIRPAYIRAAIAVGCSRDELKTEIESLTFFERTAARIAGGIHL